MKRLLLLTLLVITFGASAQTIKFRISGHQDTTINLIRYVGNKLYMADTAEMKNGVVVFDGSKHDPGIMAVTSPIKNMLNLFITKKRLISVLRIRTSFLP